MTSPGSELERALSQFRREHGVAYLRRLSGEPRGASAPRARRFLLSEHGLTLLEASRSGGELDPDRDAATCAHLGRALLEQHYEPAREAGLTLLSREVSVEGETRPLGSLLDDFCAGRTAGSRERALRAMAPELARHASGLLAARSSADAAVGELFGSVRAARHPDAGPEAGGLESARSYLAASAELTGEALTYARHALKAEGEAGFDNLWLSLGLSLQGLFPRDGRFRRLASDWEPLGLRRLLAARARRAADHPGAFAAPHVVVLAAPNDVRVSAPAREYGLASELTAAESVGRAVGLVHGSEALPFALRFAPANTVARTLGSLAVQRMTEPRFLRRVRGLSGRESEVVARVGAAYQLLDARLAAASVLTRRLGRDAPLDEAAGVVEQALLGPVEPAVAAALVLRSSPGAPFRAKVHGPALAWALREQFDEDWYQNPRAAEPLRGAALRAGTLSVERFAEELGADLACGIRKLAELF